MGARLDSMYPCFPVGILYVTCNLLVEGAQGWVCGVGGAEVVTLSYQSKGVVRKVRDEVGDVVCRDMVFGGSHKGSAELGLPSATGGGSIQ